MHCLKQFVLLTAIFDFPLSSGAAFEVFFLSCLLLHSLARALNCSITHLLDHSLARSLYRSLTYSISHLLAPSIARSLTCSRPQLLGHTLAFSAWLLAIHQPLFHWFDWDVSLQEVAVHFFFAVSLYRSFSTYIFFLLSSFSFSFFIQV